MLEPIPFAGYVEIDEMNKPVAWWDGKEPNVLGLSYHQNDYCPIPLYTHPVKELDEPNWKEMYWEMHELNHKHWSELKDHTKKLTDEEINYEFDEFVWTGNRRADFELIARAILRKAQEK